MEHDRYLENVHRWSKERNGTSEEKLFFFMDKGMYHKVGDNENHGK